MIPLNPAQLTLPLDPALADRHPSLKSCFAACVYQRGVERVAGKLDLSPSHLSEALGGGGDRGRKVDLDWIERYVQVYGDTTPILYLVAKYLQDPRAAEVANRSRIEFLLGELAAAVGDTNTKRKR